MSGAAAVAPQIPPEAAELSTAIKQILAEVQQEIDLMQAALLKTQELKQEAESFKNTAMS